MVYHLFPPEMVCLSPPTLGCLQLLPLPLLSTTQPITFRVQDLISWSHLCAMSKTTKKCKKNRKNSANLHQLSVNYDSPPLHFPSF